MARWLLVLPRPVSRGTLAFIQDARGSSLDMPLFMAIPAHQADLDVGGAQLLRRSFQYCLPVSGGRQLAGELQQGAGFGLGLSKACLLYTSPSPRDVEESRMPSSA